MAFETFGKTFETGLEKRLAEHIEENHAREISQHNGGLAVNLTEEAVDNLSERLVELMEANPDMDKDEVVSLSHVLIASDFGIVEVPQLVREQEKEAIDEKVSKLIGMDNAKQKLLEFKGLVDYVEATRDVKVLQKCLNLVITGNPGTGKTTLARLFARFMFAYGVV